jgi:hypothetical protein
MGQLPGVDVNNPELQAAIADAARQMGGNGSGDADAEGRTREGDDTSNGGSGA